MMQNIKWIYKKFDQLFVHELYEVMALRERVFIVEQDCAYLDADGLDPQCMHFMGIKNNMLVAYLRVTPPNTRFENVSIGRVITHPDYRGQNLGRELTKRAIEKIREEKTHTHITISAQSYLEKFYSEFGFKSEGAHYKEDDIPHVKMILDLKSSNPQS